MSEAVWMRCCSGRTRPEKIVAVETGERETTLFIREGEETVTRSVPFVPWLAMDRERHFPGAETTELAGEGYNWLVRFPQGWRAYQEAKRTLRDEHAGVCQYGSAIKQFLVASGLTLFKGMAFDDLKRLQIDIETTTLDPNLPDACIFMVSIGDNRGLSEVLIGEEPEMLRHLLHLVETRDPDVIEGHNFYSFDLPYLLARCAAHNISPTFGRAKRARRHGCAAQLRHRHQRPAVHADLSLWPAYFRHAAASAAV